MEDVFWVFNWGRNTLEVPQEAISERGLRKLQGIPDLDHQEVVAAMGSAENHVFIDYAREA